MSTDWFDFALAWDIVPTLLRASVLSVAIVVAGFAAAVIGGLPLLLLRRARQRMVARAAGFLVEFVRSTPLLVQIYFFFFVLPDLGIRLPPVATGIIALGFHYACFMSEIYRSVLDAVPAGQWDGTTALSFSRYHAYRHVILPQILPRFVPAAGNLLIFMLKDTPLLASIGVADIMFVAKDISIDRYQFLEPVTVCGVIFLILSTATSLLVRFAQSLVESSWSGHARLRG